jgi:histidinol phosphatase-like PHP family hydrolase
VADYAVHGLPVLHSSDAHYLHDLGAVRTTVTCLRPDFAELVLALQGLEGRRIGDA